MPPEEVKRVLIECGRDPEFTMNYFKVNPKLISPEKAIVYLYQQENVRDNLNPENFVPYVPEEVEKYSSFPDATKVYYREMIGKGMRTLLFHRIPHILYKGTLDINDLETGVV